MAKKRQIKNETKTQEEGTTAKISTGHYNLTMTNLLGYEIIKNAYDSTVLAIEDSQKFSEEVRTKGLQFAGLLVVLIVALITGVCTVDMLLARIVMVTIALILTKTLHGIFKGIIYRKKNGTRGNTQSYLFKQEMIDALATIEEKDRAAFFLASRLKGMEQERFILDKQTRDMQDCFERETKTMTKLLTFVLITVSVIVFLFHYALTVY